MAQLLLEVETSYAEQILNLFRLKEGKYPIPLASTLAHEYSSFTDFSLSPNSFCLNPQSSSMRLPYTPNPPHMNGTEEEAILSRILARRGDNGLIALDRTLLHAPAIADGWNAFMTAIRSRNSLPGDVRELVFCRVAALTGAWYEWDIHSPIARSEGLGDEVLEVVKGAKEMGAADGAPGLSELQTAVIRYVDAMTLHAHVADQVWQGVAKRFNEKELVELTASVAGFNLVSRFVVALNVDGRNDREASRSW